MTTPPDCDLRFDQFGFWRLQKHPGFPAGRVCTSSHASLRNLRNLRHLNWWVCTACALQKLTFFDERHCCQTQKRHSPASSTMYCTWCTQARWWPQMWMCWKVETEGSALKTKPQKCWQLMHVSECSGFRSMGVALTSSNSMVASNLKAAQAKASMHLSRCSAASLTKCMNHKVTYGKFIKNSISLLGGQVHILDSSYTLRLHGDSKVSRIQSSISSVKQSVVAHNGKLLLTDCSMHGGFEESGYGKVETIKSDNKWLTVFLKGNDRPTLTISKSTGQCIFHISWVFKPLQSLPYLCCEVGRLWATWTALVMHKTSICSLGYPMYKQPFMYGLSQSVHVCLICHCMTSSWIEAHTVSHRPVLYVSNVCLS